MGASSQRASATVDGCATQLPQHARNRASGVISSLDRLFGKVAEDGQSISMMPDDVAPAKAKAGSLSRFGAGSSAGRSATCGSRGSA